MVSIEYSKAISEVIDILHHTKKEDVDKISPEFMNFLKTNASKEYIPNLDHTKRIKDMNLNEKTIGILSIINSKFWCTLDQKRKFNDRLKENEAIYQKEMRKKYNPDNIFEAKLSEKNRTKNIETLSITEYKETIFAKIVKKIKRLFNR